MADVVLSTVDLDVFGGPTSVDVSVDFGATGQRGSRIWSGTLEPAQQLVGQDVQLFDYYINTTTAQVYQYLLRFGVPVWEPFFSLTLPQFSRIDTVPFTNGGAIAGVPTALIDQYGAGVTVDDIVYRYSIEGSLPIAASFTPSIAPNPLDNNLEYYFITFAAAELHPVNGWQPLNGNYKLHSLLTFTGGGD